MSNSAFKIKVMKIHLKKCKQSALSGITHTHKGRKGVLKLQVERSLLCKTQPFASEFILAVITHTCL